ncbi:MULTISPECIES: hypothetical protein [Leuconostoc]|uniref:hypothetical protein n=1 Tax=Leuconostoc TaxID=1243 RepID=UPI00236291F5|nr:MULTISPECIES: hypothetical protein [Leuconostoc]
MANNIFKQVALVVTGSVENITDSISKVSLAQRFFAEQLKENEEVSLQKALTNDWKSVGDDMRKGILKYDRKLTR